MLQVPSNNNAALSLPPSQTPTLVGRTSLLNAMAAEGHSSATDVQWIEESNALTPTNLANARDSEEQSLPKVSLTFLVLSGKRKTWEFEQTDSLAMVKDRIFNEWPSGAVLRICSFAYCWRLRALALLGICRKC
jgi:hypothetical protein